jgi:hypothetical protein
MQQTLQLQRTSDATIAATSATPFVMVHHQCITPNNKL